MATKPIDWDSVAPQKKVDWDSLVPGGTPPATLPRSEAVLQKPEGGVMGWLNDVTGDIKYGTGRTLPGRIFRGVGGQPTTAGVPESVGDLMAGPVTGPTTLAHGVGQMEGFGKVPEGDPLSYHVRGFNQAVKGGLQTASPFFVGPNLVPGLALAGAGQHVVEKGGEKAGLDPESAEAVANLTMLGIPALHAGGGKMGEFLQEKAPAIGKVAGWGTAGYEALRHGTVEPLIGGYPAAKGVEIGTRLGGKALQGFGESKPLINPSGPLYEGDARVFSPEQTEGFRRDMGMKKAPPQKALPKPPIITPPPEPQTNRLLGPAKPPVKTPQTLTANKSGGANYTADDLAALKAKHGIADVPSELVGGEKPLVEIPTEKPVEKPAVAEKPAEPVAEEKPQTFTGEERRRGQNPFEGPERRQPPSLEEPDPNKLAVQQDLDRIHAKIAAEGGNDVEAPPTQQYRRPQEEVLEDRDLLNQNREDLIKHGESADLTRSQLAYKGMKPGYNPQLASFAPPTMEHASWGLKPKGFEPEGPGGELVHFEPGAGPGAQYRGGKKWVEMEDPVMEQRVNRLIGQGYSFDKVQQITGINPEEHLVQETEKRSGASHVGGEEPQRAYFENLMKDKLPNRLSWLFRAPGSPEFRAGLRESLINMQNRSGQSSLGAEETEEQNLGRKGPLIRMPESSGPVPEEQRTPEASRKAKGEENPEERPFVPGVGPGAQLRTKSLIDVPTRPLGTDKVTEIYKQHLTGHENFSDLDEYSKGELAHRFALSPEEAENLYKKLELGRAHRDFATTRGNIPLEDLHPRERAGKTLASEYAQLPAETRPPINAVVKGNRGTILDGHHRFLAAKMNSEPEINANLINLNNPLDKFDRLEDQGIIQQDREDLERSRNQRLPETEENSPWGGEFANPETRIKGPGVGPGAMLRQGSELPIRSGPETGGVVRTPNEVTGRFGVYPGNPSARPLVDTMPRYEREKLADMTPQQRDEAIAARREALAERQDVEPPRPAIPGLMTPEERERIASSRGLPLSRGESAQDLANTREQAQRFLDFQRQLGLGGQFETQEGARATPITRLIKKNSINLNELPANERDQIFNVTRWAGEHPYKPGDVDINREPEPPVTGHPKKKPPKKEK